MVHLHRRIVGGLSITAACLAAAPLSQASLVCWTEGNGQRNWGNCTAPCDQFFAVFGNYCNNHPDLNVSCYNLSSTNLTAGAGGTCEVCVTGYGPGVDGAGFIGRYSSYIHDGDPFFIVQRSGATQVVFRVPSSGAVFVATLPPGPPVPAGSTGFTIATRQNEPPAYPPTGPYCTLPTPPLTGGDFAITYSAVDPLSGQLTMFSQQVFTYGQLSFRLMPPACAADVDSNGVMNTADLTGLLGHFGGVVTPFTDGDTNGDGDVNTADLVDLLGVFGQHCP